MNYQPLTAVWEVTMGCNMRCGHCGSSCEKSLPDELSTQEAFQLIDEIANLGLKWITLSGGEPLTRKDLPQLINRLSSAGIAVNIITNGWKLSREMATTLKQNKVSTVAISLDGTEEVHDSIRRKGSFSRIAEAFRFLKEAGIVTGAVTTVSKKNFPILSEIRKTLIDMGVASWQLQIALPMGNLKEHPDWLIAPEDVNALIDFCYQTACMGEITVYPADCIGYYTQKEVQMRQIAFRTQSSSLWEGCNAGVRGFGILHNGDIVGCTSIRSPEYIEGNVKKQHLREIWENPSGFSWRRDLTKNKLSSDCAICIYGSKCLGGCPNTRLTMEGSVYSENKYCSYNVALKQLRSSLFHHEMPEQLFFNAKELLRKNNFQEAAFMAERIIELGSKDLQEVLEMKGFAEFMCGNYALSAEANKAVLDLSPDNAYAMKGYGLALHKRGDSEMGIQFVEKAAKLTAYQDFDILNDLNIIKKEALEKGAR
jgi:radical SAM protein with 4Fe4S-binding SPASM domain